MRKPLLISLFLFFCMFSHGFSLSFSDAQSLYKTNESSGNLIDYSANQFIGDLPQTGTVSSQTGHILGARGAYSSSDYFSKSDLGLWNDSDSFTIAMWIMPSTTFTAREYLVHFETSGALTMHFFYDNQYASPGIFSMGISPSGSDYVCGPIQVQIGDLVADQWYFVAAEWNGSSRKCNLYVNNTSNEVSITGSAGSCSQSFDLGYGDGSNVASNFYFEQISIWNSSLDQEAIDWLYNNGTGQNYSAPGNSTSMTLNYPDDNALNTTTRTINFGYTPTFYGGVPKNCSLYTNESGWGIKATNSTALGNGTVNTITYAFASDNSYTWGIGCWDQTMENFTSNRTLILNLTRNATAINIIFPTSVYQNSENRVKANVSDLVTNLSVTFGTMSINLTKADSTSIKENMTYDSNESLWLSGNHTFDALGLWTLVLDYYGEDLFGNSTNSSNVTVNAVPVTVSSVGGSGGGINCYYNWTCSGWAPANCPESGKQARQCVNAGTCRGTSGKPLESQNCSYASPIPKQLLDVVLSIENNALSNSSDLVGVVSFTSFGKEPADISTTYRVFDKEGRVLYTSRGQVIVYTNKLETIYFKDLELPAGDYNLELEINYFNVTDKFRQEFRVIGSSLVGASAEALNIPGMVLIIVAALGIAGVIYMLRPPGDGGSPPRAQPLPPPMDNDETYPLPRMRWLF